MWGNYGRILAEYMFLSEFRFKNNIEIKGQQILDELKENKLVVNDINNELKEYDENNFISRYNQFYEKL